MYGFAQTKVCAVELISHLLRCKSNLNRRFDPDLGRLLSDCYKGLAGLKILAEWACNRGENEVRWGHGR